MLTKEHRPILAAFATYDAGLHDLPAEMVRRRVAVTRLQAALDALGEPPAVHRLEQDLASGWAEAACDADPDIDLTAIEEAEAANVRHQRQSRLLGMAVSEAGAALADAVHTYADEAIREHLAPALAKIVEKARKAVATYIGHGTTAGAMLNAPAAARNAYQSVDELAAAFSQVRQTRYQLLRLTGEPQQDNHGDFGLIRNADKMWPTLTDLGRIQFNYEPPWRGLETRALFEWLTANPAAEVWLPTAAEQDQRWFSVFGPRVAEMQANRHGAEALLSVMGGRG